MGEVAASPAQQTGPDSCPRRRFPQTAGRPDHRPLASACGQPLCIRDGPPRRVPSTDAAGFSAFRDRYPWANFRNTMPSRSRSRSTNSGCSGPRIICAPTLRRIFAPAMSAGSAGFTQEGRERILTGMMRVSLLKRLESSIDSFRISLQNAMAKIAALESRMSRFEEFRAENPDLDYDTLTPDELDDPDLADALQVGRRVVFKMAHLDLATWRGSPGRGPPADRCPALLRLCRSSRHATPNWPNSRSGSPKRSGSPRSTKTGDPIARCWYSPPMPTPRATSTTN